MSQITGNSTIKYVKITDYFTLKYVSITDDSTITFGWNNVQNFGLQCFLHLFLTFIYFDTPLVIKKNKVFKTSKPGDRLLRRGQSRKWRVVSRPDDTEESQKKISYQELDQVTTL